jgi:hypothetical protein
MKTNETRKLQQGDVILKTTITPKKEFGKKLNHLILQKSDISQHAHVVNGSAILYEGKTKDEFYLEVKEDSILTHEEHKAFTIPKGKYYVYGVREFDPFEEEIRRIRD